MLTRFSPDLLGSEETVTSIHLLEILNVAGHFEKDSGTAGRHSLFFAVFLVTGTSGDDFPPDAFV